MNYGDHQIENSMFTCGNIELAKDPPRKFGKWVKCSAEVTWDEWVEFLEYDDGTIERTSDTPIRDDIFNEAESALEREFRANAAEVFEEGVCVACTTIASERSKKASATLERIAQGKSE